MLLLCLKQKEEKSRRQSGEVHRAGTCPTAMIYIWEATTASQTALPTTSPDVLRLSSSPNLLPLCRLLLFFACLCGCLLLFSCTPYGVHREKPKSRGAGIRRSPCCQLATAKSPHTTRRNSADGVGVMGSPASLARRSRSGQIRTTLPADTQYQYSRPSRRCRLCESEKDSQRAAPWSSAGIKHC